MIKYYVVRLTEFIGHFGKGTFDRVANEFKTEKDTDVQEFLINRALIFDKENLCRTYLIFNINKNENKSILAGYFTITCNKAIDLSCIKKKDKKIIFGTIYGATKKMEGAFLIGQLGRNDCYSKEELPGEIILSEAYLVIFNLVKLGAGRVIMLECKKDLEGYYNSKGFRLCGETSKVDGVIQSLFLRRTDEIILQG